MAAFCLTRGKRAVKESLSCQPKKSRSRGLTPLEEADFWIRSGLDKEVFKIQFISREIGSGVFTTADISKGDFLLQYVGELVSKSEAVEREKTKYKNDKHSYLYFFRHQGKELCIDASRTYNRMGRMANDSTTPNCRMKKITLKNSSVPYLSLFALCDIKAGSEVVYDYGVKDLPWRKKMIVESDSEYDSDPFGLRGLESEDSIDDSRIFSLREENPNLEDCTEENEECERKEEENGQESLSGIEENEESEQCERKEEENRQESLSCIDENEGSEECERKEEENRQESLSGIDENEGNEECERKEEENRQESLSGIDENEGSEECERKEEENRQESLSGIDENEESEECERKEEENRQESLSGIDENEESEECERKEEENRQESLSAIDENEESEECERKEEENRQESLSCGNKTMTVSLSDLTFTGLLKKIDGDHDEKIHVSDACREKERTQKQDEKSSNVSELVSPSGNKILSEVTGEFYEQVENSSDSDIFPIYASNLKLLSEEKTVGNPSTGSLHCKSKDTCSYIPEQSATGRRSEILESVDFMCWVCEKHFKRKGGLTTHMKMHFKEGASYKKPKRMCPFCYVDQCDLTRHLVLCHIDNPEVDRASKLPKGSEERNLAFANFRKEGIFKHNKKQASLEKPNFMAERPVDGDIIACTGCKGFYRRSLFYRHKERCVQDSAFLPTQIHLDVLTESDDEFTLEILSRFQQDEVGNICRTDSTIILIGKRLFQKNLRKVDKTMEIRKSVMSDMRVLGRLYVAFKEFSDVKCNGSEDMYIRTNFTLLEQAIEKITKDDEGKLKYGTKHHLYYLLKSSAEFIIGNYLSRGEDAKAKEIKNFAKLLELNRDIIFGDAAYAINLSRQESLRMPEQQADEEDIQRLHQHIMNNIKTVSSEFTFMGLHEFVLLRDSVCARLTLFNARRGGEPSRLKLSQLQDAFNGRWVDKKAIEKLEEWEQKLFRDLLIAYQPGKGNHLVPVLIPHDLVKPLKLIASSEVRERASIHPNNIYVFAMTELSVNHVHGWASIDKMCKDASCLHPELLTASKQRHRISTMYCALEVPESEREYFYKHMGHTKHVNIGTYQYPLPVMEVTKVGRHLQTFDKCSLKVPLDTTCTSTDTHSRKKTETRSRKVKKSPPETSRNQSSSDEDETDESHSYSEDSSDVENMPKSRNRTYFRWDEKLTNQIRSDFSKWIQMSSGNCLPSKADLMKYLGSQDLGCSYKQLRTKIMNEQNKQQKLFKERCSEMNMDD